MIFNLLTIKWEVWARWIEILSIDVGWSHGALLYIGIVEREWEFDILFIRFIWGWWMWRGRY